jgi:hypothetical protein
MDELHRFADKFFTEVDHLDTLLADDPTEDTIDLALSQAKRVRRQSVQLVRVLAELRDDYSRRA